LPVFDGALDVVQVLRVVVLALGLIRFRRRQMKGGYDGSDVRSEAAGTT
jgi:hypothetical protein